LCSHSHSHFSSFLPHSHTPSLPFSIRQEYIPIDGLPEFTKSAATLLLGENSPAIKEKRVAALQSLSGTGALRLGAELIRKFLGSPTILISDPTWGKEDFLFFLSSFFLSFFLPLPLPLPLPPSFPSFPSLYSI
jgi:hypothetical protein